MSFLYWIYVKATYAPQRLRHIPQASFFPYIRSFFRLRSYDETALEITLPAALKSKQGLYVAFDINGWTVHITRPEAAKKVFYKPDLFPKRTGSGEGRETLFGRFAMGPSVLFLNGAHWKAQRMVINPAFHRAMPVELFGQLTQKLFAEIDLKNKSIVDFQNLMTRWTLDALGLAGFGFDFDSIKNPLSLWVTRYENIMRGVFNPLFLIFSSLDGPKWRSWFPGRKHIHDVLTIFLGNIQSIITAKRQELANEKLSSVKKHTEKDLLTLLLEASAEGHGSMTDEELMSNLCTFFFAGHDNSANSLTFAAYNLAAHPDIQNRAREEVIRILGDVPETIIPTPDQLREMTYLNMFIKESMRRNSSAAIIIPRVAAEDTDLEGVFIPKGTPIVVDLYEIMHNPTIWSDPETFDPDRFSPGGEADRLSKSGFPWVAFGNGARQCIGMNFSLTEQRVLLAMLLHKYEISLPENTIHKEKLIMTGYGILKPADLQVVLKKRY
ncbi:cytochrome P450 [Fennellomyces sp. T-0311]|nr:cytochrome P450 [Fennellomyces sp. T-0311]